MRRARLEPASLFESTQLIPSLANLVPMLSYGCESWAVFAALMGPRAIGTALGDSPVKDYDCRSLAQGVQGSSDVDEGSLVFVVWYHPGVP